VDLTAFASWSSSEREPSFRSLYDAEGVGSVPLFRTFDPASGEFHDPLLRPERVNDWEVGASWRRERSYLGLNLFRLDFEDELVDYQFNSDLGYAVPANAARSVHQGVEVAGRWSLGLPEQLAFTLEGNATLSDNHFIDYVEVIDPTFSIDHHDKTIGFFPATLANLAGNFAWRALGVGAEIQHIGRMYLDHTEDRANSLDPRTIANATGSYRFLGGVNPIAELRLRVFNVFDTEYEAGGYMDFDATGAYVPHFIPAAGRTVLGELRVDW
jgi:outer membrane receptor protein involved in Fe transport